MAQRLGMKIFLHLRWTNEAVFDNCYHCCTIKNAWEECGVYSKDSIQVHLISTDKGKTVLLYPKDLINGDYISEYPVMGECVILQYGDVENHIEMCWKEIKQNNKQCLNNLSKQEYESYYINPCSTCKNEHDDDSVCTHCEGKGGRRFLHERYDQQCKVVVDLSPTQIVSPQYTRLEKKKKNAQVVTV